MIIFPCRTKRSSWTRLDTEITPGTGMKIIQFLIRREFRICQNNAYADFVAELWRFMRVRKKFWLLPILIMMVVFGGLVVLTKGTVFAPFIYTLF